MSLTIGTRKCFLCDGEMELERAKERLSIRKRSAVVDVEQYRCTKCDEVFLTPELMDAAQRALAAVLRDREKLLGPEEIRRIRERHRLSQAEFEKLLGVGPKTVVRWERGTVFQNHATDELLRVIDGVPGVFEFLAHKNGVEIREPIAPAAQEVLIQRSALFALPEAEERRGSKVRNMSDFIAEQKKAIRPEPQTTFPDVPIAELR